MSLCMEKSTWNVVLELLGRVKEVFLKTEKHASISFLLN